MTIMLTEVLSKNVNLETIEMRNFKGMTEVALGHHTMKYNMACKKEISNNC